MTCCAMQVMMAASEQGWNATTGAQAQTAAGQICHAHAVAQPMLNCVFVTHVSRRLHSGWL